MVKQDCLLVLTLVGYQIIGCDGEQDCLLVPTLV